MLNKGDIIFYSDKGDFKLNSLNYLNKELKKYKKSISFATYVLGNKGTNIVGRIEEKLTGRPPFYIIRWYISFPMKEEFFYHKYQYGEYNISAWNKAGNLRIVNKYHPEIQNIYLTTFEIDLTNKVCKKCLK